MKISELTDTIEHFFLEIIGVIIPGLTLITGILLIFNIKSLDELGFFLLDVFPAWIVFTISGYVLGHLIADIERRIFIPSLSRFFSKINIPIFISIRDIYSDFEKSVEYQIFKKTYQNKHNEIEIPLINSGLVHFFRNIAITMIDKHRYTVKEFMFISHFNSGIATSIFIINIIWLLFNISWVKNQIMFMIAPINFVSVLILFLLSLFFFDRGFEFYSRSLRLPFSIALSIMNDEK